MGVTLEIGFECRSCGHIVRPIVLPQSIQEEITRCLGESLAISSILEAFVACPQCGLVSFGRAADFQFRFVEISDPQESLRTDQLPIRAHTVCATETCGTPFVIHTTAKRGTSDSAMREVIATWVIPGGLTCPRCHRLLRDCLEREFVFEGPEGWSKLN